MTEEQSNIISMRPDISPVSTEQTEDKSKSKYIPPRTLANPTEFYLLPNNQDIINDFKLAGGCFDLFLKRSIERPAYKKVVGMQILEQLAAVPAELEEFERTRAAAERAEALLARDEVVKLSKEKGQSQITALKMVQDFVKDHAGKTKAVDPMDKHLSTLEE